MNKTLPTKKDTDDISIKDMKKILIIVVQLALVYCFSGEFQPFFYQAF